MKYISTSKKEGMATLKLSSLCICSQYYIVLLPFLPHLPHVSGLKNYSPICPCHVHIHLKIIAGKSAIARWGVPSNAGWSSQPAFAFFQSLSSICAGLRIGIRHPHKFVHGKSWSWDEEIQKIPRIHDFPTISWMFNPSALPPNLGFSTQHIWSHPLCAPPTGVPHMAGGCSKRSAPKDDAPGSPPPSPECPAGSTWMWLELRTLGMSSEIHPSHPLYGFVYTKTIKNLDTLESSSFANSPFLGPPQPPNIPNIRLRSSSRPSAAASHSAGPGRQAPDSAPSAKRWGRARGPSCGCSSSNQPCNMVLDGWIGHHQKSEEIGDGLSLIFGFQLFWLERMGVPFFRNVVGGVMLI